MINIASEKSSIYGNMTFSMFNNGLVQNLEHINIILQL